MEQIFEIFADLSPVDYFFLLVSVLSALVLFFRTGTIKKIFKEVVNMKFQRRKPSYLEDNAVEGQTFSNLKPVYRLNKATGELEKTDEVIDITELVNSYKDIAIDNILNRFLSLVQDDTQNEIVEYNEMVDDVDVMREMSERAEVYRKKYKLPESMPTSEVFDFLASQAQKVKSSIEKKQQLQKELKKGDEKNEKAEKVVEESK